MLTFNSIYLKTPANGGRDGQMVLAPCLSDGRVQVLLPHGACFDFFTFMYRKSETTLSVLLSIPLSKKVYQKSRHKLSDITTITTCITSNIGGIKNGKQNNETFPGGG